MYTGVGKWNDNGYSVADGHCGECIECDLPGRDDRGSWWEYRRISDRRDMVILSGRHI